MDEPINLSKEEPMPEGTGVDVFILVHKDLEDRKAYGISKYKETLTTFNGRDALVDAYQEALDLVMFLRQEIEERNARQCALEDK